MTIEAVRSHEELSQKLAWGGDTKLSEAMAADYLGMKGTSTLERHRAEGTGPRFLKYPGAGVKAGRNSMVVYRMRDLQEWEARFEKTSNRDPTPTGRIMGWTSLADTRRGDPWISLNDRLIGHGLAADIPDGSELVWASLEDVVMDLLWNVAAQHSVYAQAYIAVVEDSLARSTADQERDQMMRETPTSKLLSSRGTTI